MRQQQLGVFIRIYTSSILEKRGREDDDDDDDDDETDLQPAPRAMPASPRLPAVALGVIFLLLVAAADPVYACRIAFFRHLVKTGGMYQGMRQTWRRERCVEPVVYVPLVMHPGTAIRAYFAYFYPPFEVKGQ